MSDNLRVTVHRNGSKQTVSWAGDGIRGSFTINWDTALTGAGQAELRRFLRDGTRKNTSRVNRIQAVLYLIARGRGVDWTDRSITEELKDHFGADEPLAQPAFVRSITRKF
jgi:hypothetical protein